MTEPTRNIPLGFALGFLGVVVFGGTLPATVVALNSFGPLFIASSRATIAAILAALHAVGDGILLAARMVDAKVNARLFALRFPS